MEQLADPKHGKFILQAARGALVKISEDLLRNWSGMFHGVAGEAAPSLCNRRGFGWAGDTNRNLLRFVVLLPALRGGKPA
jgi:hypothetical protein